MGNDRESATRLRKTENGFAVQDDGARKYNDGRSIATSLIAANRWR